ncbi:MAG: flippase [Acetivibrio ethanolgignens]
MNDKTTNIKLEKKLTTNYLYNLSFQVFAIIVPIITTPYISRVLGAEKIGIYSYTLSISTYFIVAGSLGFPLYGQREIAYNSDNRAARSKCFFEIIYGQIFFLMLALISYFCFVIIADSQHKDVFIAQSVGIIGGVLATSWFYLGVEEFKVTAAKNIIVKIVGIIGLFAFVKQPSDLVVYTVIIGASNLFGNIAILFGIRKYVDFSYYRCSAKNIFKHVKPAFILGIPYYITSIYAVIDKTMLGLLGTGYAEVGYYEQSQKIVTLVITVITSIGTVLMPRLASELSNNNDKAVRFYLNKGTEICVMLGTPIMFGILSVAASIVPWFFGEGFEKVTLLLKLFSPLALVMGLSNLIGTQYLTVSKREKELTITILVSVIINCCLNALLIPKFDSVGATIATLLAEILKLLIQMFIIREIINIKGIMCTVLKYSLVGMAMYIVVLFFRDNCFIIPNIINSVILCLVGALTYCLILIIVRDKNIINYLSRKR